MQCWFNDEGQLSDCQQGVEIKKMDDFTKKWKVSGPRTTMLIKAWKCLSIAYTFSHTYWLLLKELAHQENASKFLKGTEILYLNSISAYLEETELWCYTLVCYIFNHPLLLQSFFLV